MDCPFPPTRDAALARVHAVRPDDYARSRNSLEGAVSHLSPYITHGLVSLPEVLAGVLACQPLSAQHKFVFELGWREYFRHVWTWRGTGIFDALHPGLLPETEYATGLPLDIRQAATGVPVIDTAVRTLYATGYLHNHARMWLASYIVHLRKVHWRVAADWLYGHLLDGDLASNHLSWQWVAGTGSSKPYLFNADNVSRFAPLAWHSPHTVVDQSYEALERIARASTPQDRAASDVTTSTLSHIEPPLRSAPPPELGWTSPDATAVAGRDVWLVHPWNLGELPCTLAPDTVVVGLCVTDFHRAWPWNEQRWHFVTQRMAELVTLRWQADAATLGAALQAARRVRSMDEPHLQPWLSQWAECAPAPLLFPVVDKPCESFSQWWTRASRGITSAADLLTSAPSLTGPPHAKTKTQQP
jgi:deoxyribodipyrimidine photo-lyase